MISVDSFFDQEKECVFKDETYSVRNNGAVMRHARPNKIKRKLDEVWTFGTKNETNGYMYINSVRVHQIVAEAFLEPKPSSTHVIDHKDTNKCNNRPDNLRWATRLENALNNPITRKRIILCCGSIEKFLENPALLRAGSVDQNFDWMRTVSPDEAKISKEKLERWAKEDSVPTGNGKLGPWVYKDNKGSSMNQDIEYDDITQSLTKNVLQINWLTPTRFPQCPSEPGENPLQEYLDKLKTDVVFAENGYGESKVLMADFDATGGALFVATYTESKSATKGYALAKIEYDQSAGIYYHESRGTFFGEDGVTKYFTEERGHEWTGGEVIDDLC